MYKTIQSALHKIKASQRGVEEALKMHKRIYRKRNEIMIKNSLDKLKDTVQISCIDAWEKKCF